MRFAASAFLLAVLAGAALGAPTHHAGTQNVQAALPRLDRIIEHLIADDRVPGLAVAVIYRGEVVFLKGYGVRKVGESEAVDADTVFQIASMSKPIASTVVARLVGEGTLAWDTRIHDIDPDFRLYDDADTAKVTVRDFLAHRSGLWGEAGNDIESLGFGRDEILHRLRYLRPAGKLRQTYAYSNFGFTEGGIAAAKAAGMSWEDLAERKLFAPLGMTSTSARYADFARRDNRAELHTRVDGKWAAKVKRQPDAQAPAGGVSTSVGDLTRWMRLQLGKGVFEGHRLVKARALAQTHARVVRRGNNPVSGGPSFYGLGWATEDSRHGVHWNHSGAFSAGARTAVDLIPDEQIGIVVLCNAFPSGVPEGVAASFYDFVFDGQLSRDWIGDWDAFIDKTLGQGAVDAASGPYRRAPISPVPALPASAYIGTYENDYVGRAVISEAGGNLSVALGPAGAVIFPLIHLDGNLFLIYPSEEAPTLPSAVQFGIGADGQADRIVINIVNGDGQGLLKRIPD